MLNSLPNMDSLCPNVICGSKEDLSLSLLIPLPPLTILSLPLSLFLSLSLQLTTLFPLLTHHIVPSLSFPSLPNLPYSPPLPSPLSPSP